MQCVERVFELVGISHVKGSIFHEVIFDGLVFLLSFIKDKITLLKGSFRLNHSAIV